MMSDDVTQCERYSCGLVIEERATGRGKLRKSMTERFLSGSISAQISPVKIIAASDHSISLLCKYFELLVSVVQVLVAQWE